MHAYILCVYMCASPFCFLNFLYSADVHLSMNRFGVHTLYTAMDLQNSPWDLHIAGDRRTEAQDSTPETQGPVTCHQLVTTLDADLDGEHAGYGLWQVTISYHFDRSLHHVAMLGVHWICLGSYPILIKRSGFNSFSFQCWSSGDANSQGCIWWSAVAITGELLFPRNPTAWLVMIDNNWRQQLDQLLMDRVPTTSRMKPCRVEVNHSTNPNWCKMMQTMTYWYWLYNIVYVQEAICQVKSAVAPSGWTDANLPWRINMFLETVSVVPRVNCLNTSVDLSTVVISDLPGLGYRFFLPGLSSTLGCVTAPWATYTFSWLGGQAETYPVDGNCWCLHPVFVVFGCLFATGSRTLPFVLFMLSINKLINTNLYTLGHYVPWMVISEQQHTPVNNTTLFSKSHGVQQKSWIKREQSMIITIFINSWPKGATTLE